MTLSLGLPGQFPARSCKGRQQRSNMTASLIVAKKITQPPGETCVQTYNTRVRQSVLALPFFPIKAPLLQQCRRSPPSLVRTELLQQLRLQPTVQILMFSTAIPLCLHWALTDGGSCGFGAFTTGGSCGARGGPTSCITGGFSCGTGRCGGSACPMLRTNASVSLPPVAVAFSVSTATLRVVATLAPVNRPTFTSVGAIVARFTASVRAAV